MNDEKKLSSKDCLVSLEWDKIDTHGAHEMKDDHLLRVVKVAKVGFGWGLVAEICKRFNERVKNDK